MASSDYPNLPTYAELAEITKDHPVPGHAWDVWNKPGSDVKDSLGSLNLLTPRNVLQAKDEIRTGIRVQIDMPLNALKYTLHERVQLKQEIVDYSTHGIFAHDDVLTYNTQSSSQWDGFAHYADQKSRIYYGGVMHDDIVKTGNKQLGTDHWVRAGGIVGRGILLDYVQYCETHNKSLPNANSPYPITVQELDEMAKAENVKFKVGDILFMRTGFTKWYEHASDEERKYTFSCSETARFIGLGANTESRDWLWNHHFAAVAGDTFGFEVRPHDLSTGIHLHQWLLPRWGIPIGELFNLESLAKVCWEQKRWTFFFTSAPTYVPGGVASPPNGIAIF